MTPIPRVPALHRSDRNPSARPPLNAACPVRRPADPCTQAICVASVLALLLSLFPPAVAARPQSAPQSETEASTVDATPAQVPDAARRLRVAVAGFAPPADADQRDAWIAAGVEETLAWRLRRVPSLITTPTVRVHQAARELAADPPDRGPEGTPSHPPGAAAVPPHIKQIVQLLGAERLVTGVAAGPAGHARLSLRIVRLGEVAPQAGGGAADAGAREGVVEAPREAEQHEFGPAPLFEAIDQATEWVLGRLGAAELDEARRRLVFAPPSTSPSALEYYVRALAAVRGERARDAAYYASEAVGYDLRFRPALMLLAQIELRLSRESQANAVRRLRVLAELARLTGDVLDRAETELTLGLLAQLSPNPDAALLRFETALTHSCEAGDVYGQIAAMNLIGDYFLSRRPPDAFPMEAEQRERLERQSLRRALEWQRLSLDELDRLNDVVASIPATNKLALIHERLGEHDAALALHERTLAAARRTGSRRSEATAWMFLGQWHRRHARWDEAIAATSRCLELAAESSRPAARIALGEIYQAMEPPRTEDALAQFEAACDQLRAGADLSNQLVCLRQVAELRRRLGRRESAAAALREAIELAHALESPQEPGLRALLAEWEADGR